jgi:DNA-binding transcriptional ArsR family regulator
MPAVDETVDDAMSCLMSNPSVAYVVVMQRDAAPAQSAVARAMADPTRRRLVDVLVARGARNQRELGADLDLSRQAVAKHLQVLEAAGLVTTAWRGREKFHVVNVEPILAVAREWLSVFDAVAVSRAGRPASGDPQGARR